MKISFESTIEDVTEAQIRRENLHGVLSRRMWLGTIGLLLIVLVLYFVIPGKPAEKAVFGVVAGVVAAGYFLATYRSSHRSRVYERLAKVYGGNQPTLAEFELTPEGIVFRRSGLEEWHSWEDVRELRETDRAIELVLEPDGLVVFPKRIFSSPEAVLDWLDYIQSQLPDQPRTGL